MKTLSNKRLQRLLLFFLAFSVTACVLIFFFDIATGFLLYQASEVGNLGRVKLMLRLGANPNTDDGEFHNTALMAAAENGQTEVVSVLVQHKANVNAINDQQQTAYTIAMSYNYLGVARTIKNAGGH